MLVKVLKGKSVNLDYNFPFDSCISIFDSGKILTIKNQQDISYGILILDSEQKVYQYFHLAFHATSEFKRTHEIFINDHVLIFYNHFTKIGVFNSISQSFNIMDSGLKPKENLYYYNEDIYDVQNGQLRVLNFNEFPKISEFFLFQNIRSIKQIIQLESKQVLIMQQQSHPNHSYYTLPVRPQQEQLYFDISTIKFMNFKQNNSQPNSVLTKIYLERIEFEEGIRYHYKSYNDFSEHPQLFLKNKLQLSNGFRRNLTLFQFMPKQRILRKFKQLQFNADTSIMDKQFILGYRQSELKTLFVQDITTAGLSLFESEGLQILKDNLLFDMDKETICVYELSTKHTES